MAQDNFPVSSLEVDLGGGRRQKADMNTPSSATSPPRNLPMHRSWRASAIIALFGVAPGLLIGSFLWIQWKVVVLHPEVLGDWHPTLSKSLNDPDIAGPFNVLLIFITPFLLTSIWMVTRYYWAFCSHLGTGRRHTVFWHRYVAFIFILQVVAAIGMLMIAYYPSHSHSIAHVTGSYMLFFGHAASILLSGFYSHQLGRLDTLEPGLFWMKKEQRRWRISLFVGAITAVYPFLFYAPNISEFFRFYGFSVIVSAAEVVTISVFLLYLLNFVPEILRFDRYKRGLE